MGARGIALAAAWAVAAWSGSAFALTVTLDPLPPVIVGQPQTFKPTQVDGSSGSVTYRWNFGDGTVSEPSTTAETQHTYAAPGHYTIILQAVDDVGRTSAVRVQAATYPLTPTAPKTSSSILADTSRNRVFAVNSDGNVVVGIDSQNLTKVFETPVGQEPHALAQAPDGTLWVPGQQSDDISLVDPDTGAVLSRIALPYASQPRGIAVSEAGKAYVSLYATGKLLELDTAARKITRELAIGPTPAGVSIAADGRIFVTRFLSPVDHGEVWVVEPGGLTLANTIPLAFDLGPDTQSSGRGVPNYVASVAISPDGTQAWVSAKKDDTARGLQRDGQSMTSDNFARSAVCVLDMASETEILSKRQDIDNRSMPVQTVFSPLGDYAMVAVLTSNWFGVMDAYNTQSTTGVKDVGNAPDGLVLLADGRLFVNAFLSREVLVYDMSSSLASMDHSAPEPTARISTVTTEPLTPQLLLGKRIFYNAADTRMGHASYWSCATCHFGGYSDGRVWDFTDRGEGLRNTKSLLGIRGATGEGRVHWTGNMDEIQDFERDIRESFQGSGFMSDADYKARLDANGVYDPMGLPAAGVSPELDALAAYITSLDKVGRSPFRNPDGSFSDQALKGREIFASAACAQCHSGPDFTDSPKNELHDVGTLLPTSGFRLGAPLTGLDTPTLKGLWQTAPYLHDGRAQTLEDVFAVTGDRMGITSNLAADDMASLVRYLLELDDVPETPRATKVEPSPMEKTPSCSVSSSLGSASDSESVAWLGLLAGALALGRRRRAQHRNPVR